MGKPIRGHCQFKDTILLNDKTYFDYLDRFKKIALSMFEWKNLPDSMDSRYIELSLYYLGMAAFLKDEEYGFINTKATFGGSLNIYGIPTNINCWSFGYHKDRKTYMGLDQESITENVQNTNAVLVMNNFDMVPTAPTLELFAQRLAEAQRAIDINVKSQKHPYLFLTTRKDELSVRNALAKIDDNEWYIIGDRNLMTMDQFKAIDVKAPYVVDKLTDYKKEIWNEALSFLGISNIDYKRERMISSETDSKNELINLNLQSYLITRKKACEQFNQLYGENIDVAVRSDLHNIVKELENSFDDIDGREEIMSEIKEEQGVENE